MPNRNRTVQQQPSTILPQLVPVRLLPQLCEMADSLIDALEKVHLGSPDLDSFADDWIDSVLDTQRPRKRIKQDQEQLSSHLEQTYLTPPSSFSQEWLNKLQQ